MSKKLRLGVLTCLLAALSTIALGQSFTTFVNARVTTQLDLQGTLTANGSTGTSGQVLTSNGAGDITWSAPAVTVLGANPTASVGLTAVNGVATTYLRSDGAPALSQSITPTWTGTHTFTRTRSAAGEYAMLWQSNHPATLMYDNDAASNEKGWRESSDAGTLIYQAMNDADTSGNIWMQVDRTGTTIDSVALASTALTWNGSAVPNVASSPTWTGFHTFSNANLGIGITSSAASVPVFYTPTGQDAYRMGAGSVAGSDFGLYNVTRTQPYMTFTGGASGGEVLFQRSGAGNLQSWSTGSVGATWSADHISSGHVILTTTSELVFTAPTLSISQAFNPDADLGATLGTSALRFSEAHAVQLCEAVCTNTQTIGSSGTTVYLGNGTDWTDVNIPNVLQIDGASSARMIINDTSGASTSSARFSDNGTLRGLVGSSNASGQCITGDSQGDVCLRAESGALRFSVNGGSTSAMAISSSGQVVVTGSVLQVNSQNVCLQDGTNCPVASETTGTFNVTATDSAITCGASYSKIGNMVVIKFGTSGTCTYTSTSTAGPIRCTTGCVPAALRPPATVTGIIRIRDNSIGAIGSIQITSSGTLDTGCGGAMAAGCTSSSSKGLESITSFSYNIL